MGAKYEHKTEQVGASYETDYKLLTLCVPDCPACAFQAGMKEVVNSVNLMLKLPSITMVNFKLQWEAKIKELEVRDER